MNSMTLQELKVWLSTNKNLLKGLNIRVTTARTSTPFNTLKAFGEYILRLEKENYTSARIGGFHYAKNPFQQSFNNDHIEKLSAGNISGIEISVGGGLTKSQASNLARHKTQKLRNR